jgi:hypothetical protein
MAFSDIALLFSFDSSDIAAQSSPRVFGNFFIILLLMG